MPALGESICESWYHHTCPKQDLKVMILQQSKYLSSLLEIISGEKPLQSLLSTFFSKLDPSLVWIHHQIDLKDMEVVSLIGNL